MTDQVTPEGGATPVSGATATFAQAKAEAVEAEAKAKPKESAAASPPDAPDPGEKKVETKDGRDIRISELTRRLREAERRTERLLKLAEERGQPAQSVQPQQTRKTLKDFGYDENAYREYTSQEARNEAKATAQELAEQLRAQESATRRREKYEERAAAFAKANEGFHETVSGDWACSQPMAEAIEESEEGPALAFYLAENPDVALQMSKLSAVQAVRELTKLENRLVDERKKAAEKPVTQAPPPPPKIEGSDPGNIEKDPSKMTDAQFRKWREGTMARRR